MMNRMNGWGLDIRWWSGRRESSMMLLCGDFDNRHSNVDNKNSSDRNLPRQVQPADNSKSNSIAECGRRYIIRSGSVRARGGERSGELNREEG